MTYMKFGSYTMKDPCIFRKASAVLLPTFLARFFTLFSSSVSFFFVALLLEALPITFVASIFSLLVVHAANIRKRRETAKYFGRFLLLDHHFLAIHHDNATIVGLNRLTCKVVALLVVVGQTQVLDAVGCAVLYGQRPADRGILATCPRGG